MPRDRDLRRNTLLAFASLFFGLMLSEAALRLLAPQPLLPARTAPESENALIVLDDELGWRLRPNATGGIPQDEGEGRMVLNPAGFRDEPHEFRKRPGVVRIAVVGDSFVFGSGVLQEEVVTRRLGERLGAGYEVLNFGVPGYGTDQEFLLFQREIGRYRPDIVLLGFFWNDLLETTTGSIYGYEKPLFSLRRGRPELVRLPRRAETLLGRIDRTLRRRSHLYVLAGRGLAGLFVLGHGFTAPAGKVALPISVSFSLPENVAPCPECPLTFGLVREMQAACERLGESFAVFGVPPRFLVDDEARLRLLRIYGLRDDAFTSDPFHRLRRFCEANGIRYIDLLPAFRAAHRAGRRLFNPGIHWSREGHALAAEVLARDLVAR